MDNVRIYLTENCNASCAWCFNKNTRNPELDMDTEKIKKLIDYLSEHKLRKLRIMGGEPTLHPDFVEIWNYALGKFPKMTLFTNGTDKEKLMKINIDDNIGINFNFNFVDAPVDPDICSKYGSFATEVVIRKETDVQKLLDKFVRVHEDMKKQNAYIKFILTIDCTLDIFKYRKEMQEKLNKIIDFAIEHNDYYWGWDHTYPRCFLTEDIIKRLGKIIYIPAPGPNTYFINQCGSVAGCSALVLSNFKLVHCNQYRNNSLDIFNPDGSIIPYNRFANFLKCEGLTKFLSLQNTGCMDCKFFMAGCNGGCVGHKFKH